MSDINEVIFVVHHKPSPLFLDYRGKWAQVLGERLNLEHWKINKDRIDVYSEDLSTRAFISFQNFGLVQRNKNIKTFSTLSESLLNFILEPKPYENKISLNRIGLRQKSIDYYSDIQYSDIITLINEKISPISNDFINIIGSKFFDYNVPATWNTSMGKINTNIGPINSHQVNLYFDFLNEIPNIGLYMDIDYYKVFESNDSDTDEISRYLRKYSNSINDIYEQTLELLGK